MMPEATASRKLNAPLPRWFAACFALPWLIALADQPSAADPPFLRFRDTTLGYHGPATAFTNLTDIRLGWFGPTNLNHPLTGDLWWAAHLAVQEANQSPPPPAQSAPSLESSSAGIGGGLIKSSYSPNPPSGPTLPVRLIPRWAMDPWGTGVSQLTRMVYDEQPLALLGSVDSAATHLAEQVVAKAQLPLVSPIATDKSITLAGVSWMFSCAPSDAAIARALVRAVLAELKPPADRCVLLAATDHASRMTTREVVSELARHGRQPDFRFDLPPGATNLSRQFPSIAETQPAVVLIIADPDPSAQWVRMIRNRFDQTIIFGSQAMGRRHFLELAGPDAEGVRFPLLFVPDATDPRTARFLARFTAERHHPPDYTAALTYDATRLLIEAIRRAGPNRARIREVLVELSPWTGVAGMIQWDGTGQNTRADIKLGSIRSGRIVVD